MASNSDFTETTWGSPSKRKSQAEPSKQALEALEMAEDAALEFDEKFTVRSNEREQTVPRFNGAEVEIGRKPIRNRGYYIEYELKSVVITPLVEGDFANAENDPRTRLAKRCGDGHYAVKYIQEGLIDSDVGGNAAADAIFETKILMNLSPHPNICQIYGINGGGIDTFLASGQKRFFIITDRLSETLVDRLDLWREGKGYTDSEGIDKDKETIGGSRWNQRLEIALDIAAALVYLSDRMLVYNVRPDKVGFDTRYGQIKLSNFSQVRQHGMDNHASSITKSDDIKTLAYTAPEVLCKAPATISSDVYGFGIMLWEMLSLQRPFDGYDRSMHFEEVVQLNFRPTLDLKWPKAIRDIVGSCWNPHRRPTIKVTHESIEECLLFRDSEDELKKVFRTIKQKSPGGHNFANSPSSPSKSPPKTKGSLSAPKTPSKSKTPSTPTTPKSSVSKQGVPGVPGSPAEQRNGGRVVPKTPKTLKSGAPNSAESKSPKTPDSSAPNSAESKRPKTPRSRALNRAASSDGMPDIAKASGRQGRILTKEAAQPMRSRSVSITRKDDTNKEVPSLFAKLDSESIHEMGGGVEDEVSMFATLDAEFGDGSDGTAPTVTSSSNSAGSVGSDGLRSKVLSGVEKVGRSPGKIDLGKLDPPAILKVKAHPLPVRKVSASNISMTPKFEVKAQPLPVRKLSAPNLSMNPKFGSLSQTTHGTFPEEAMPTKADSLSQTTHEVFSFGVFDDDPTSVFQKSQPTRAKSFNTSNVANPFLAKNEVASLFSVESAAEGQSSTKRGSVSSLTDVPSGADDSFAKWDALSSTSRNKQAIAMNSETDPKLSTNESPAISGSCNSRESRSTSRDDEPTTKMKRSMSMGKRNSSKMRRSRSVGRRVSSGVSSEEEDDSPSAEESPKLKQESESSNTRKSRPSSRDGDQASKMRRSRSVGRSMSVEDDAESPSVEESTKSKQVSASPSSRESRPSSRDGDQPSKLKRSKSLGRRKPTGDEDSPSTGESPKSKQVSASSSSRESRPSSRDGDQASKIRRSMSVGRSMSVEDEAESPSAGESPKSKQVSASANSRESRPSSRDGDQPSTLKRSKSLGRKKPTGDEDNPSAGEGSKSKSRESRTSSRDDDPSSKMRRSKSTGRRMSSDGEGDAHAEDASRSRESRSSTRDDDQSSKMRRSKSTGRRMSSDGEGGVHAEEASRSRESRSSSRDDDQTSKMRRSKSTGRRISSDAHDDVPAGEKPEPSESKPFRESRSSSRSSSRDDPSAPPQRSKSTARSKSKGPSRESRSSSRDDPSAPPKRSKSTARSKSKGPNQSSKEDPSGPKPKTSSRGGTRTVIRMSSKELMEMGFDPANMPKSSGKSKGGRILVPGLDAKDMAGRVLVKRKGKKKTKIDSKDEDPVEEPFAASDFNLGSPKTTEVDT
jgi:hypothetical protein